MSQRKRSQSDQMAFLSPNIEITLKYAWKRFENWNILLIKQRYENAVSITFCDRPKPEPDSAV